MNLVAESRVTAADGEQVGQVVGIDFNPATNQIVALRVRGLGQRQQPAIVVPVEAVADILEGEVLLSVPAEAFRRSPTVHRGDRGASPPGARAATHEVLHQELPFGAAVVCLDGPVGPLRRILYDQYSYDIEELVIGTSQWLAQEVAVPVDWVRQLHGGRIVLSSSRQEVLSMPPAPEDR